MSKERKETQLTNDDELLGAALGRAISNRVDNPVTAPATDFIAKRAAAQAKTQTTRRMTVAIAAVVALFAGGFVAWNALDDTGSVEEVVVANGPEGSSDLPQTGAPSNPNDPEAGPEGPSNVPVAESSDPAAPFTESPLQWTEYEWAQFDPDLDIYKVESVGDGRLIAYGTGSDGPKPVVTSDGVNWDDVPVPDGVVPDHINISGDRWLVVSQGETTSSGFAKRVFYSDDQGANWTELAVNFNANPPPISPHFTLRTQAKSVLVSGQNIAVVGESRTELDVPSLIVFRGLAPNRQSIVEWEHSGNTVVYHLDSGNPDSPQRFEMSYDDLGLTADEQALIDTPSSRVHILVSDGTVTEQTADYDGFFRAGLSSNDGFFVVVSGQEDLLLTSTDGQQWNETPALSSRGGKGPNGTVWFDGESSGTPFIQSFNNSPTPETIATLSGFQSPENISVGSAGFAVTAIPDTSTTSGSSSAITIDKDGYQLRIGTPDGGVTLWDLSEDAEIYSYGPEEVEGDTPPAGIRGAAAPGSDSEGFAFIDLETGGDLVAFTRQEIEEATLNALGSGEFPQQESFEFPQDESSETLVGWSTDGTTWGWQTLSGAFDISASAFQPLVDLSVGDGFVLAQVQPTSPEQPSLRWFIATVE